MAYHCIIVPFDGSDHAQSALNAACGIAKGHETQVHVVNVVPINIFPEVAASDPAADVYKRQVIGYSYASAFRPRKAYLHSIETSVYLAPEAKGFGLGSRLYGALEEILRLQNVYLSLIHI